jgi:decaprenyl-phosphate phosphoribosyltransferase
VPPILRLLRPHQYAKNLLVFAAPGAAGRLDEPDIAAKTLVAFVLFCAVSSMGYVINDLVDAEADRQHPVKKNRPIASREVSVNQAIRLLVMLGLPTALLSAILGWNFLAMLAGYALISLIYSILLKRVPWIELVTVSAGFLARAVAGGAATDTPISGWFLLVVSAGALLVITGKRLGELLALGGSTPSRKVLASYKLRHLQLLTAAASALAVGGYTAWAAAKARGHAPDSDGSLLLRVTVAPFTLAIGRYLILSWRGAGETPEALIVRDRFMHVAGTAWIIVYSMGLYL